MGLLNGGIASVFHSVFSGIYLDGTLHAGTGEPIYGPGSVITGYSGGDSDIKVQTDATGDAVRDDVGFAEGDVTLIILALNVPQITSDHEVTDGYGEKFSIQRASLDAARSHWVCRGRKG
ncbi:hypothetical protein EDF56_101143 [Novosphingobium sp. PhB165]|uniref:hypothetical protein n=1 Tax=Novosphingobium sp. PhB165 TaxID=2485105 RepID=UPI001042B2DD|nr:hypothetical protein [Novosphingobium sp. PhB165]TCM21479.1 hypothetical protein EDF56_101143 [Novosphingobium sp. PhB165]